MDEFIVRLNKSIPGDEQKQRLALVYKTILSWSEALEIEPADSENFDQDTETADENAPTCESEADLV